MLSELIEEHVKLIKLWGSLNGQSTEPDIRNEIFDFIALWSKMAEIKALYLADWIGITSNKYYHWKERYGEVNEHNETVPRDHWPEEWERKAIVDFWIKTTWRGINVVLT